jgi:hypothetical protein
MRTRMVSPRATERHRFAADLGSPFAHAALWIGNAMRRGVTSRQIAKMN